MEDSLFATAGRSPEAPWMLAQPLVRARVEVPICGTRAQVRARWGPFLLQFSFAQTPWDPQRSTQEWSSSPSFQAGRAPSAQAPTTAWRGAAGGGAPIVCPNFVVRTFFFFCEKKRAHSFRNPAHFPPPRSHAAALESAAVTDTSLPPGSALPGFALRDKGWDMPPPSVPPAPSSQECSWLCAF